MTIWNLLMFQWVANKASDYLGHFREQLLRSPILFRIARGAFWTMLATAIGRIFTFGSTILVARMLGKVGYGEQGMVLSTVGLFGVFAGFGLGSTATKYVAEYRERQPDRTGRIIGLTILVGLVWSGLMMFACIFLSPWLSKQMLNRPSLQPLLVSGSVLMFVSTMSGILSAALTGFEAFRKIAAIGIWKAISIPIVTIPMVWWWGVEGAIWAATATTTLGAILSWFVLYRNFLKDKIPLNFGVGIWREWQILWAFSLPAMASSLMIMPTTWITNSYLVNQKDGYAELGLFTAANQWRNLLMVIPSLLSTAILPILSETFGRADKREFRKTVELNIYLTWIIALPLTVLLVTFGTALADVFGRDFGGGGSIVVVLMIACFLNIVNFPIGSALAGSGKMWTGTLMNLGWAIVLVWSAHLLVPLQGALGLGVAYLLAYLVHTIWQMAYLEIEIAPMSIAKHWKLGFLSLCVLGSSVMVNVFGWGGYVLKVAVLVSSAAPLAVYARGKLLQRDRETLAYQVGKEVV